jgi:hypothetical protein
MRELGACWCDGVEGWIGIGYFTDEDCRMYSDMDYGVEGIVHGNYF